MRLCVGVVSLTFPHSNKEENMCAMCVSFLSCKKKKLKDNGKVHSHRTLSSLAVHAVILLTV